MENKKRGGLCNQTRPHGFLVARGIALLYTNSLSFRFYQYSSWRDNTLNSALTLSHHQNFTKPFRHSESTTHSHTHKILFFPRESLRCTPPCVALAYIYNGNTRHNLVGNRKYFISTTLPFQLRCVGLIRYSVAPIFSSHYPIQIRTKKVPRRHLFIDNAYLYKQKGAPSLPYKLLSIRSIVTYKQVDVSFCLFVSVFFVFWTTRE
mmetsp:Transcript_24316/g.41297  ORF Transcript_24316/g.41297 Transcript_24316/m.41297 type:complete len:206 (-) Transcript_24316:9-626(-)